ncbi:uncharacterized protein BBOV_IV005070 [Babesia bovis T2Bo]|uniref:Pre-mRNA-splicing factor Syf1/CRNKL1-like C-terminal HAT-repeats domain-containing protein n=1 Tax=Babesia bovis TaxID=5865 RepID=A7AQP9_BABBO|nr:uncharacterized protein BBOV_IV005070 [Babesia bovis T2Bo]EDO06868.1 hypothetical protein BBOV_IV005070 [Babesia bovis T2Bo]BAN64810.1 conserved hypothetical protein [Babesia bovis]|eukprot:XP_001610436.1 hypothetical protein [Babesia bovis T2Bo]
MVSSGTRVKRRASKPSREKDGSSDDVTLGVDSLGWSLDNEILSHVASSSEQPKSVPSDGKIQKKSNLKRRRKETVSFDLDNELAKETELRAAERRLLENESSGSVETVFDFEKRVATGGNSASLWIEYMAFHLRNGSLEGARQVVRRGLERIDFRAISERLTLWVANINMECLYGDRVKEVFQESLRFNDPKTMYLKMISIFVKNDRLSDAIEVCERGIKKLGKSKKFWQAYLRLLFEHVKDFEEARKVYNRCLLRIPDHKKVYMMTSTALLEFKFGSAERGQMMFENLLLDNPRRMDIWMQYICAYIKFQLTSPGIKRSDGLRSIRNLFLRIITLDLKPKKMKVIYQKWMEFECNHGDSKSKSLVQQKALEYVESVEAKLKA